MARTLISQVPGLLPAKASTQFLLQTHSAAGADSSNFLIEVDRPRSPLSLSFVYIREVPCEDGRERHFDGVRGLLLAAAALAALAIIAKEQLGKSLRPPGGRASIRQLWTEKKLQGSQG